MSYKLEDLLVWRPLSLSELTPIITNMELTHLGSEAFISSITISLRLSWRGFNSF